MERKVNCFCFVFFELCYILELIIDTGNVLSRFSKFNSHTLIFSLNYTCLHKSQKAYLIEIIILHHFVVIKNRVLFPLCFLILLR